MNKPFKELSEDRQLEIVENLMGDDWHQEIICDIERELLEVGIEEPSISFTGFWSQGDGASFTAEGVDLIRLMKEIPMDFQSEQLEAANDGVRAMATLLGWDAIEVKRPVLDLIFELEDRDVITCTIQRTDSRYFHENTVSLELEIASFLGEAEEDEDRDIEDYILSNEDHQELNNFVKWLEPKLQSWLKDKCREIYGRIEKSYESYQENLLNDLMEDNEEWGDTSNSRYY